MRNYCKELWQEEKESVDFKLLVFLVVGLCFFLLCPEKVGVLSLLLGHQLLLV